MAAFDAFLRLAAGRGAQAISRILPTPKDRVLDQIRQASPEFFSPDRAMGATFDPRRGRFLEAGVDRGQMMSPIRNMPENVVRDPEQLLNFAQRPDVMPTLQRGGFMGSWFDPEEGGLVVDPSRRFATRTGALIQGLRSNQKAGFDIGRIEEFPVSREALARPAGNLGALLGAAGGGTAGVMTSEDTGINPVLAGLAGAAVGAAGGRFAARDIVRTAGTMAARRGVLDLGSRQRLEAAGVPVVARTAAEAARNFMKSNGIGDDTIKAIPDDATEESAWATAYKALLEKNENAFGGMSKTIKEQRKVDLAARTTTDYAADSPEVAAIASRGSGVPIPPQKGQGERAMAPLSPEYKAIGVRKVRHVGSGGTGKGMDPAESLDRLPEAKRRQALVDVLHNLEQFIDDGSVAAAVARGGSNIFYNVMMAQRRLMSAMLNEPVLLNAIRAGIASHRSSPMRETAKVAASFASRAKGVSAGKMIDDINLSVDRVVQDLVSFLKNPRNLYGAQDKVLNYLATQIAPAQKLTSVIDSWMIRAAFGNIKLQTTGNPGGYGMIDEAVGLLAKKYGVDPSTMQEIIWNNARIVANKASGKAFAQLGGKAVQNPDIPMKTVIPTNAKTIRDFAADPKNVEIIGRFKTGLVEAVEQNPQLAKYFELSGEDIGFTDDFFKLLRSMQTRESGLAGARVAAKAKKEIKAAKAAEENKLVQEHLGDALDRIEDYNEYGSPDLENLTDGTDVLGKMYKNWLNVVEYPDFGNIHGLSFKNMIYAIQDAASGRNVTVKELETLPAQIEKLYSTALRGNNVFYYGDLAILQLDGIRKMNDREIETVLALLPEWNDTVKQLIATSKSLAFE